MAYLTPEEAKEHLKTSQDFTNTAVLNEVDQVINTITRQNFTEQAVTDENLILEEYSNNDFRTELYEVIAPSPIIEITSLVIDGDTMQEITSYATKNNNFFIKDNKIVLNRYRNSSSGLQFYNQFSKEPYGNILSARIGYSTVPTLVKRMAKELLSIFLRDDESRVNYGADGSVQEASSKGMPYSEIKTILEREYLRYT